MSATEPMRPSEAAATPSLDARLARLQADCAAFELRLAQLERSMREASAEPDTSPDADSAAADRLPIAEPADEIKRLNAELAVRARQHSEVEATARGQIAELSEALSTIEESVSWRATAPLRAAGNMLPRPVQGALFSLAKSVYWVMTPHRMASRLRWLSYEPALRHSVKRLASLSEEVRTRLGTPLRRAYGESTLEQLDIYPAAKPNAPVFVFIHGGAWREGEATNYAFPAEMFVTAGVHYVVPDFIAIKEAGGDPRVMAEQVRRSIAWVYSNAESFGGDRERIYIGGHSSGAHLAAIALVTDWQAAFALPPDILRGGLLMSGVFDLHQARGARHAYLRLTEESAHAMSPQKHLALLRAPVLVTCGGDDTPQFRQHARNFAAAATAAGRAAELIEAPDFNHMEMLESLGNPYGPNGRAALDLMRLSPSSPIGR